MTFGCGMLSSDEARSERSEEGLREYYIPYHHGKASVTYLGLTARHVRNAAWAQFVFRRTHFCSGMALATPMRALQATEHILAQIGTGMVVPKAKVFL